MPQVFCLSPYEENKNAYSDELHRQKGGLGFFVVSPGWQSKAQGSQRHIFLLAALEQLSGNIAHLKGSGNGRTTKDQLQHHL